MNRIDIKKEVRERYGRIARDGGFTSGGCSCCGEKSDVGKISRELGYDEQDLESIPKGANMGLGCGNPVAIASLKQGETVLDLGSGGGIDCFLASEKVGFTGQVIGVDMTPDMVERARVNAKKAGKENIDFRLGEIENLPVADSSVDVVISNCVINLTPDKRRVFQEIYRVLKPGGRFMISDIVLTTKLSEDISGSIDAYIGCISGAVLKEEYLSYIKEAGFNDIKVVEILPAITEIWLNDAAAGSVIKELGITMDSAREIGESVLSMKVAGKKV